MDKNASAIIQDDQVLIRKLKEEGAAALEVIYKRYRLEFIKFSNRYSLDDAEVLDTYQDVMIALYENVINGKIDSLKSSLKTYVFGIGKYKLLDKINENKRMVLQKEADEFPEGLSVDLIEQMDLTHRQKLIKGALNDIGGACKELLHYFYYRRYSIESIRLAMKYKDDNVVKAQKSRCMKSLRSILKGKDIL